MMMGRHLMRGRRRPRGRVKIITSPGVEWVKAPPRWLAARRSPCREKALRIRCRAGVVDGRGGGNGQRILDELVISGYKPVMFGNVLGAALVLQVNILVS